MACALRCATRMSLSRDSIRSALRRAGTLAIIFIGAAATIATSQAGDVRSDEATAQTAAGDPAILQVVLSQSAVAESDYLLLRLDVGPASEAGTITYTTDPSIDVATGVRPTGNDLSLTNEQIAALCASDPGECVIEIEVSASEPVALTVETYAEIGRYSQAFTEDATVRVEAE